MPRRPTISDDIGTYVYVNHPPYVHAIKNTQCVKHTTKRDLWYVYDVRKNQPVQLNPVFKIRYDNKSYSLINTVTNKVIFGANSIMQVAKFADANLPPLKPFIGVTDDERCTVTNQIPNGTDNNGDKRTTST